MDLTPAEAGDLITLDYAGMLPPEHVVAVLRVRWLGLTATLVRLGDGSLVVIVRGTDSLPGWVCNILFLARSWPGKGDSGRRWHGQWLKSARRIIAWLKELGVTPVAFVGHSKGAAEASIVGWSLQVRTIAIACPRPLVGKERLEGEEVVEVYNRSDDSVCDVPFEQLGYRQLGDPVVFHIDAPHKGEDHRIDKYRPWLRWYRGGPKRDIFAAVA